MKKLLGAGAIAAFYFTQASLVFAEPPAFDPCADKAAIQSGNRIICKIQANDPGGVIGAILSFVLIAGLILAFAFLVIGGIRWITSGGDKSAVESARNTIIAAIIGIVVMFLAYLIITLVLQFLGFSGGLSGLKLPTLPGQSI